MRWVAVLGAVLAALAVTHALSTLVTLAMLVAAALAYVVLRRPDLRAARWPLGLLAAAVVAVGGYWAMGARYNGAALTEWAGRAFARLAGGEVASTTSVTRGASLDVGAALLTNLGLAVFLALFLAGCVALLRTRRPASAPLLGGSVALFGGIYAGVALGAAFLLPHRWLVFAFALGAPVAAIGLEGLPRARRPRAAGVVVVALVLTAGLALSPWANADSPLLDLPTADRYGFTAPELAAASFAQAKGGRFSTDFWFVNASKAPAGALPSGILEPSAPPGDAVLLRRYVLDEALSVPVNGGYYVSAHTDAHPLARDLEARADVVYDSGAAQLFVLRPQEWL